MLREDYERFISIFPEAIEGKYKLMSLETDKRWVRAYGKVYDSRTIMIENANYGDLCGVNIDIFPVDRIPDDEAEWLRYSKRRHLLQRLFEFKIVRLSRKRNVLKNLVLLLGKILLCPISARKYAEFLSKYSKKFAKTDGKRLFECVLGLNQIRPFSRSLFDEIVEIPFEDRHYCAVSNTDELLTGLYGNYMQLPPEEKRVTHHDFIAYWK
jgi:lipopolysaccharide cholinephosphotransferase